MVRELVEEFFRDLKQLSVGDPETIRGQNRPIRGQKSTIWQESATIFTSTDGLMGMPVSYCDDVKIMNG